MVQQSSHSSKDLPCICLLLRFTLGRQYSNFPPRYICAFLRSTLAWWKTFEWIVFWWICGRNSNSILLQTLRYLQVSDREVWILEPIQETLILSRISLLQGYIAIMSRHLKGKKLWVFWFVFIVVFVIRLLFFFRYFYPELGLIQLLPLASDIKMRNTLLCIWQVLGRHKYDATERQRDVRFTSSRHITSYQRFSKYFLNLK